MSVEGWADRGELAVRLALLATPGLGDRTLLRLLDAFGSARAAWERLNDACDREVAERARSPQVRERARRALDAIEAQHIRVLARDLPGYPALLRERLDEAAPPLLFARGHLPLLDLPAVAVVGSRSASAYGLEVAAAIGEAVARAGAVVISGVALGIDAAAHEAALACGGATIGVLGCGVDVYYPRRNLQLQDDIAAKGLLLSELLPGEPPRRHQFPHRNRIIAALSRGVVVVEAGERSGALSTAVHAMEQGVPLFAVPNAVDRPTVQGILGLFDDGVPPYTGPRSLLEQCGIVDVGAPLAPAPAPGGDMTAPTDPGTARLWAALGREPLHVDRIAAAAGTAPQLVLGTLLQWELDGLVAQHPGARFCRVAGRRNRTVPAG